MNRDWLLGACLAVVTTGCTVSLTEERVCEEGQLLEYGNGDWMCVTPAPRPTGLADLSCAPGEVVAFDEGKWGCVAPPQPTTDTLTELNCSDGQFAARTGSEWVCRPLPETSTDTLAGLTCADGAFVRYESGVWGCATPPLSLEDLPCSEGQVASRGPAGWTCAEPPAPSPLVGLNCSQNQVVVFDGSGWTCVNQVAPVLDTLTRLSCASGQTVEFDGSNWRCATPPTPPTPTRVPNCGPGERLVTQGGALACAPEVPSEEGSRNLWLQLMGGNLVVDCPGGCTASSPGFVMMRNQAGSQLVSLQVTAAAILSPSELSGSTFGVTAGRAWTPDRPFYVYAINLDDQNVAFGISDHPNLRRSPAPSAWGNPAPTTVSGALHLFDAGAQPVSPRPVVRIGAFTMTKAQTQNWTPSVGPYDGIGRDHVGRWFTMARGQMGAEPGSYFSAGPDAPPTFSTDTYEYTLALDGRVHVRLIQFPQTTNGVGTSTTLRIALPYARAPGFSVRMQCVVPGPVPGNATSCRLGGSPATGQTQAEITRLNANTQYNSVRASDFPTTQDGGFEGQFSYATFVTQ